MSYVWNNIIQYHTLQIHQDATTAFHILKTLNPWQEHYTVDFSQCATTVLI